MQRGGGGFLGYIRVAASCLDHGYSLSAVSWVECRSFPTRNAERSAMRPGLVESLLGAGARVQRVGGSVSVGVDLEAFSHESVPFPHPIKP